MEGQAEDLNAKVNGVAGQVALGPAPVTVFDDDPGVGGQNKIARLAFDKLESAPLQERNQWSQSGGADLFAGPARAVSSALVIRMSAFQRATARLQF